METKEIVSVYNNRWGQIQHLNELDLRSLVLVTTAVTGAIVSAKASPAFPVILEVGVSSLAAIVSAGGIYSTTRNRLSLEYAIAAIDFLEETLNRELEGLFPNSGHYHAPSTAWRFFKHTALSIRGPVLMFFAAALVTSVTALTHGLFKVTGRPPYARTLCLMCAILFTCFVMWFSFWRAWCSGRSNFKSAIAKNEKD